MIIDHLKREILVTEEELINPGVYTIENLDRRKTIFYTTIEYIGQPEGSKELPELKIELKSMTPAYHYLFRFDIHDYKVCPHEGQHLA